MVNFDARVKNSDATQLRITNVKTPKAGNIQRRGYPGKTQNMHLGIHATQSCSLKFITSKHTEHDVLQDIHMSCAMHDFCMWISVLLCLLFLFHIEEDSFFSKK